MSSFSFKYLFSILKCPYVDPKHEFECWLTMKGELSCSPKILFWSRPFLRHQDWPVWLILHFGCLMLHLSSKDILCGMTHVILESKVTPGPQQVDLLKKKKWKAGQNVFLSFIGVLGSLWVIASCNLKKKKNIRIHNVSRIIFLHHILYKSAIAL